MLSLRTASASAAAAAPPASSSSSSFRGIGNSNSIGIFGHRRRAGPPRCIDGRAGRCAARAAPAGGAGGAAPRADAAPAPPSAVGRGGAGGGSSADRRVAAAAAALASAPARSPTATDDIAVTGIAGSFASYEDPADRPFDPSAPGARPPPRCLLSAVGAEGPVSLPLEVARLEALLGRLRACGHDVGACLAVLEADPRVIALREATSATHAGLWAALAHLPPADRFLALALPAIGQAHVLALPPAAGSSDAPSSSSSAAAWAAALQPLCASLARVEAFYDSMGGLVGYQLASLRLVIEGTAALEGAGKSSDGDGSNGSSSSAAARVEDEATNTKPAYHVPPPALDLADPSPASRAAGARAVAAGVLATPSLAEIWPVGGAGDRLGLQCESTGEPLPAAMLPYAGRPILESLVRDLQAREHLHWRLTGRQCTTPLAIMTSDAKGNDRRIRALLEGARWYGRGRSSVRLVRQPLVPVLDAQDGRWLLASPLLPAMKPGGHGAIWKLLRDEGVFDWLESEGRSAALLRQISNPMAGTDTTLLALAGAGFEGGKEFGFMSCERVVGAAEGMNVLRRRRVPSSSDASLAPSSSSSSSPFSSAYDDEYVLTNVEYTEFEKLGMSDVPREEGSATSAFPANTNILYVGLGAARRAVERAVAAGGGDVLPGLIFNLKKKVAYSDPLRAGEVREVRAGRMESTMQNLADQLGTRVSSPPVSSSDDAADGTTAAPPPPSSLSTFLVRNERRKVTSSAKKRRPPGGYPSAHGLHQTPDGSFLDLMANARALLLEKCALRYVPPVGDHARYLERGPGFVALFHPALGPLWDVIGQKVRGGAIMDGSELVLEVAEASLSEVTVEGSLLVHSDAPMGQHEEKGVVVCEGAAEGQAAGGRAAAEKEAGGNNNNDGGAESRLVFSSRVGRALLRNVEVRNVGVDWRHPANEPWRHRLVRHEACRVVLRGCAEFEAHDCRVTGDALFEVPDGHRMVVTQAPAAGGGGAGGAGAAAAARDGLGAAAAANARSPSSAASVCQIGDLLVVLEPLRRSEADGHPLPSWEWIYSLDDRTGAVRLEFRRHDGGAWRGAAESPLAASPPAAAAAASASASGERLAEAAAAALDLSLAGDVAAEAAAAAAGRAEQQQEEQEQQQSEAPALAAASRSRELAAGGGGGARSRDASPSGGASAATMYMQHDEVRTVPHYTI